MRAASTPQPGDADAVLAAFPHPDWADGTMLPGLGRKPQEDGPVCDICTQTRAQTPSGIWPLTSFAQPRGAGKGNQWFTATDDAPMFFAGTELRGWTSVRKVKDGETTDDLFAFLTTEPNAEEQAVHPKAMPAILTTPEEWETRLTAPFDIAGKLKRPLPDGALWLVRSRCSY